MSWEVYFSTTAKKSIKRLRPDIKNQLIKACEKIIIQNPLSGKQLRGAFLGKRTLRYNISGTNYRIAYQINKKEKRVGIILIHTRENFYKKLKRILRIL